VPAADRAWAGADMARAALSLSKIVQSDATQLPRYKSSQSGAIFARLTAAENLELFRNTSLPIEQRLPDALKYMESCNSICKLYLAAFNQQAVGDSELIELLGSQLRLVKVMFELVGEFLPTIDKNDPSYQVRMNGLAQMKSGMAMVVAGSLETLTESHAFRTSERKRLVGYMEETFPAILPELTKESCAEALVRIREYATDPEMKDLQPELDQLLEAVEQLE